MEVVAAAVVTGAFAVVVALLNRKHNAAMTELRQINSAVNNVPAGDPRPLWQRIDDQTEAIGEVKGMLGAHLVDPAAHWDGSRGPSGNQ